MLFNSSLTQYNIISDSIGPFCSSFATIRSNGDCVPISFPLGNDGLAFVSIVRLGLWFQLNIDSLHIDEEVFDLAFGGITHTIGQIPECSGDGKHWLLRPGRFRLYDLTESTMAASTKLAPSLWSPSFTNCTPVSSIVKEEPGMESVTILSDDSDVSSPLDATLDICRVGICPS